MSLLRGRPWILRGLLILGAALLYAPFVDHPFLFDDAVQIYENPAVTQGAPIRAYFFDRNTTSSRADYNTRIYRPLRNLGFRAIAVVAADGSSGAQLRPLAFGLANLALYLVCIALVFTIARTLASERASLLAAALFATAPVHVEAVLYASAFGDLLSAALELGALVTAVRAVAVFDSPRRGQALGLAAISLVLAAAAMAAKEMAVTGVVVLALWLGVQGALWNRRGLAVVGAHGVLAFGYLALRTSVLGRVGQDAVTAQTLLTGLREAPWLLVNYARITVLPLGHSAAYVVPPPSLIELAFALALIVGAVLVARRSNSVAVRLGLGWFAVSLLPVLHLVPLWADLADRFAFVPSAGLALAAAGAIDLASAAGHARSVLAVSVAAVLLALYGAGTVLEARSWSNDAALWTHAAEMAPTSSLAQSNLGVVRVAEGRPEEAVVAFQRAIALGREGADLDTRLATALAALGRLGEARDAVRRALAQEPDRGPAYALLADVEEQLGHGDAAERALARAQVLAPEHPSTLLAMAARAERGGRPADAAAIYVGLAARLPRRGALPLSRRAGAARDGRLDAGRRRGARLPRAGAGPAAVRGVAPA